MKEIHQNGILKVWNIKSIKSYSLLLSGVVFDAELPYYEFVSSDPSIEDMKKVVCVQKLRPSIPEEWANQEVFEMQI